MLFALLVSLALDHHGPDHSRELVGKRNSSNLGRPPRQQGREPGEMLGAMDLGGTDDGERAGHEQAAQIAVTLFAYIAESVLASTRVLLRHDTDPGREVASVTGASQMTFDCFPKKLIVNSMHAPQQQSP